MFQTYQNFDQRRWFSMLKSIWNASPQYLREINPKIITKDPHSKRTNKQTKKTSILMLCAFLGQHYTRKNKEMLNIGNAIIAPKANVRILLELIKNVMMIFDLIFPSISLFSRESDRFRVNCNGMCWQQQISKTGQLFSIIIGKQINETN